MWQFWQIMLLDIGVIGVSYLIFRFTLRGEWRHKIWEKYVDSFSMFIMLLFIITILINVLTYAILSAVRITRYLYVIAPAVSSVIVGFVIASVPQRGVEDRR